jgi:alpha(1,3/1,4) fucosyltransferase
MLSADFIVGGYFNNSIFDLDDPRNRDNSHLPYYLMKKRFQDHGIEINTPDLACNSLSAFELHMNLLRRSAETKKYLLLLEVPQIYPNNRDENWLRSYEKIFSWNDDLVDQNHVIKINFPNSIRSHQVDGFRNRDRFCCLIAGNKTLAIKDKRNLYPERVKAIRWFEEHAPQDFDLFGVDWNMPVLHRGLLGKVERRVLRVLDGVLKLRPFPSYLGRIEHKHEVLARTRFSICYENVRDMPGYITEKIFDCFFSGCIPVYWGANNITDHIPSECFIDRRKFRDTGEVYAFLKAMTEPEFRGYQDRIAAFLRSDAAYPFSSEFFAETIVNTIVQDLGA